MNISFGKKIPIALGQIRNLETGNFEPATVYKVDCKDKSDYLEVKKFPSDWNFSSIMASNMQNKYTSSKIYHYENNSSFYILQNQDSETLGRVQIDEERPHIFSLGWLDTKDNNGYKYVGQTLLASVAKQVLKNSGNCITISCITEGTRPFYVDKCKFEETTKDRFYMGIEQMEDFIQRTQQKTQGTLIDLTI